MTQSKSLRAFLSLFTLCLAIAGSSCGPRRSANEKQYPVKGKVISVEKTDRTATIAHEEIPGYMPAMTMPFKIKENADLEMLKAGDEITGTLVVDDLSSWLEIISIMEGGPPVSQTGDVPGEPKPGTEVPDFGLINQDGQRIRLSQYRGKALALTFIFTRCPHPDQCTLMSNNFAAVDQELRKQPEVYNRTHLLSISFDPDYDTPKVLRSYGASHTARYQDEGFQHWEFATGTKDEVKGIAQFFGLRYYHDNASGKDEVIHSLRTAVIGPDGKIVKLYRGNEWKPEQILSDLKTVTPMPTPSATPK